MKARTEDHIGVFEICYSYFIFINKVQPFNY